MALGLGESAPGSRNGETKSRFIAKSGFFDWIRPHHAQRVRPSRGNIGTMRAFIFVPLIAGGAMLLAACAADSRSPLPEFLRAQASEPPPPEPAPDVKRMVRDKLDFVFVSTSHPQNVRVSAPHHEARGPGWTACVRAEVTSATGKPLDSQTYRITMSDGEIADRKRVGGEDNCVSEKYEPI
jgi:hypothetical protein